MLLGEGLCLWPWKALGLPVSPLVLLPLQIHLFSSPRPSCQLYCKSLHLLGFLLPSHSMPHYLLPFSPQRGRCGRFGRWNRSEREVRMDMQSLSLG